MASGLRAKLRSMGATAPAAPKRPEGGLLVYVDRRPVPEGLFSLSGAGLRRIGWSGRAFDVRRCLFLDTETTGLSGGAGTVAFLVGVGYVDDEELVVEQYLMRDYSDEPDLIDRVARRLENCDCVCTFNGRSFDMPLLEARFTMCRMRHRWRELENIDLLHPARRTWKLRLGSCRLANLETEILGMPREHDLPGSEVPQRYFEFLKSGDLSLLEDIVRHNRQDIATLADLLVRLCGIYGEPERVSERRDAFSMGKALERQGELTPARDLYRISAIPAPAGTIAALTGNRIAGMANWRLYLLARRERNVGEMRAVLEQMLLRGQMTCAVHIELSKLFEHRQKDFQAALKHAQAALPLCAEDEKAALERRIERLAQRIQAKTEDEHGNF